MSSDVAEAPVPTTHEQRRRRWDDLVAETNESYRFQQRAIAELYRELAAASALVTDDAEHR